MKISIDHIANLARLSLSDEEKKLFGRQLESILSYMDTLNELDTRDVEPTSHVIAIRNVTREDVHTPSLAREEALTNAPDRTDKFYRVPKIIE
jgi:aspartyl-tRNA(Asn)/glutamyl-tRNA(Gln) amidotransferase subunit C